MVSGTESPAWTDFHNVQADNLPDAIDEIVSNQALNHRTRADKTMHLIVSFPLGEAPGKPVMDDIGDTLMRSLGMEHHQRLSAVHTNTSHIHMHLAVNKLDPISHRNIDPGFSKLKLQAAARELEYKHKLQRLQKSTAATICGAAHKALMNPDCDWHSLQGALAEQGAQLRTRGRGLIVVDRTGHRVKASTISRDFARAKLETPPRAVRRSQDPARIACRARRTSNGSSFWFKELLILGTGTITPHYTNGLDAPGL